MSSGRRPWRSTAPAPTSGQPSATDAPRSPPHRPFEDLRPRLDHTVSFQSFAKETLWIREINPRSLAVLEECASLR